MDRVTTDEHIYLRDRKDKRRTLGKYKARDLFNIMTFAAYLTGDPGLMFYDRINRDNQFKEKIKSSNPCQPSDALLMDGDRLRKISDANPITWRSWRVGKKPLLKLVCNNGLKLRFTQIG